MAFVLARLRLALQLGTARSSGGGVAIFVLGWVAGVIVGLGGGAVVAALDSGISPIGDLLVLLLFVAIFGAWVVLPIATPMPTANIIDPEVLEQYPLSRTQQVTGLLLGGLLTPTATATFLTAVGGVAATNVDLSSRAVAVGGAVLFTLLCVASSYGVRALFTEALTARRGRTVALVLSTLVIAAIYILPHLLSPVLGLAQDAGVIFVTVLTWTPPGAAGALGYVLVAGDVGGVIGRVGVILATIGLALLLWGVALRRHVKGGSVDQVAPRARATSSDLALVPLLLHPFPAGATLGAASQHLRYYFFRAPRAAQFIVLGPLVAALFAVSQLHTAGLVFASAVAAVAMSSSVLMNLFGYDGRGVETTVETGASLSSVLRGKLLAVSLFLVPTVALFTIALGLVTGLAADIPLALVAALASLLLAFATGAACSVWNPFDQAAPQGDRSTVAVRMIGAFGLTFALVYGAGAFCSWVQPVIPLDLVLAVALVATAALALVSTRLSGAFLDRNPQRLVAAFTPR
ncbi:hypothetical protein [Microbacterium trichothecenolyticum]|uniref:ABC-2 type transport system permease protein n=1 Tax=Microbacterium trichothecenolyticum TaxID=69370 RepID=A0ABU0TY73_MICTR|nr:hypothetical protein [Microbacterium trichothecenolyticum]MDQ1124614.1 ABC-2 type transport system permease protein [Microbacterium trichothecenolyticum]